MNKKIFLLLLITILSGCTLLPTIPTKGGTTIPETRTGTQGVEITFMNNAPPNEVFENQLFEIYFGIENKGATDIINGVYVLGVSDDFEVPDASYGSVSLKGKSLQYPFGESQFFVVKTRARELAAQLQRLQSTISVDVCYPYKTPVSSSVCINPEFGVVTKPVTVCTPTTQSLGSQGAPIAVTQIEAPLILPHENPMFIKPQIIVHVKNVGKGLVVAKEKVRDACTQRGVKEGYDLVRMTGTLSDLPLDCSPQNVQLSAQDTTVVCTLNAGLEKSRGSHLAVLNLNVDYGYITKKSRPITIKRAL